jgi:hypothetical protein
LPRFLGCFNDAEAGKEPLGMLITSASLYQLSYLGVPMNFQSS